MFNTGTAGGTTNDLGELSFISLNGGVSLVGRARIASSLNGATNSTALLFETMVSGTLSEKVRVDKDGFVTFQGQTTSFPGWKRVSAGLECRLGDDSDYCTKFKAAVVATTCVAIASLPAGVEGDRKCVNNQLTSCPVLDGTFTAGGAVTCSAFYNGTAWVHS